MFFFETRAIKKALLTRPAPNYCIYAAPLYIIKVWQPMLCPPPGNLHTDFSSQKQFVQL